MRKEKNRVFIINGDLVVFFSKFNHPMENKTLYSLDVYQKVGGVCRMDAKHYFDFVSLLESLE